MQTYSNLAESIALLKKCETKPELQECFTSTIMKLGFQQFAYMRFSKDNVAIEDSIYTYSEAWKIYYFQQNFDRIDPVFQKAFISTKSFFWSACMPNFVAGQKAFFDAAANYGIFNGITTSLKSDSDAKAMMTIVAARTDENKDTTSVPHATITRARIISECFHQVALHVSPTYDTSLKPRQKQVLTLSSYGMSSKEIAAILSKSEAYINELITAILHKLGTQSRPAAVRRAIELGLLD